MQVKKPRKRPAGTDQHRHDAGFLESFFRHERLRLASPRTPGKPRPTPAIAPCTRRDRDHRHGLANVGEIRHPERRG